MSKVLFALLRRAVVPRPAGAWAGLLLLPVVAGCSGPLLTFRAAEAGPPSDPERTGSIAPVVKTLGADLNDEDWRRAHAALGVALDPQGNGHPVKWENPDSAMRGSINPTGLPYVASDQVCRDFLASVIAPARSRFVRGTGCKAAGGTWLLKRLTATRA